MLHTLRRVLLLTLLLFLAGQFTHAGESAAVIDKTKIYFGKVKQFSKPAIIERMKVYEQIASYKRIKDEKIKQDDAQYFFLLNETSKTFRKYVKAVAVAKGHDLVAEKGAITVSGNDLPNLTKHVIKKVKSAQ